MKTDIVLPTDNPKLVVHIPSARWSDSSPRIAIAPDPAEYRLRHTVPKWRLEELDRIVCRDFDVRLVGGNACASAYYLQKREAQS